MTTKHTFHIHALALALATGLAACDTDGPDDGLDAAELQAREGGLYSGEALFLGIFFGQGEVAERLPLLWGACGQADRGRIVSELPVEVLLAEVERLAADPQNEALLPVLDRARETLGTEGVVPLDPSGPAIVVELVRERDPEYFERLAEIVGSGDREAIREALEIGREHLHHVIVVEQAPIGPGDNGLVVVYDTVAVVDTVYLVVHLWTTDTAVVVGSGLEPSVIFEELMVDEIATQLGAG
jgi:hypothetical protein